MILTEKQVQKIYEAIRNKGFYINKDHEILDHCCSSIEEFMNSGLSFDEALKNVLAQEYIDSLKKMNKKLTIIHLSKFIHMKIIILGLLLISAASFNNLFTSETDEKKESINCISEVPTLLAENDLNEPPEIWPLSLPGKISSGYGMRMHPIEKEKKFHFGIDIPAAKGTPVIATSDGEIIEAGYTVNYGNYIVIKHDDTYSSKYSQLSEINVKKGDLINKGDQIGTVGSSGRSTAPHLHFEIIEAGKHVDPMKFIKA